MDANRFDALTQAVSSGAVRRGVLRAIFGGALAGLVGGLETGAAAKKRTGKRGKQGKRSKAGPLQQDRQSMAGPSPNSVSAEKKRKPKKKTVCHEGRTIKVPKKAVKKHLAHGDTLGACPASLCPDEPFLRCAEPSIDAFLAAVERCEAQCADPDSSGCEFCLAPDLDSAVSAANGCLEQVCLGGIGQVDEQGAESSVRVDASRPCPTQCCAGEFNTCVRRNDRDFRTCLYSAIDDGLDVVGCYMLHADHHQDCIEDYGCRGACEACINNVCQGCKPPAACLFVPTTSGRSRKCTCLGVPYQDCGQTCCDLRAPACEHCVAGVCRPKCRSPKVCRGELVGLCECPEGQEECADGCCKDCGELTLCGDSCVDTDADPANCGDCGNACSGGKACLDGACACPSNSVECNARCCGPCLSCQSGACEPMSCGLCRECTVSLAWPHGNCERIEGCCLETCGTCYECRDGQCVRDRDCCDPPCGACEACQDGACVRDPNCCLQTCDTCHTCRDGECVRDPDCCLQTCGPCTSCQGGECRRVDCGDPCSECRDGQCVPKACGECEACSNGECRGFCGSCQTCENGACRNCSADETCHKGTCCPKCDGPICTFAGSEDEDGCPICMAPGSKCCCGAGRWNGESTICTGGFYTASVDLFCCGGGGPCDLTSNGCAFDTMLENWKCLPKTQSG